MYDRWISLHRVSAQDRWPGHVGGESQKYDAWYDTVHYLLLGPGCCVWVHPTFVMLAVEGGQPNSGSAPARLRTKYLVGLKIN